MSEYRERKRIRLAYWDYSRPGFYYLTACTAGRRCLFGEVRDGVVELSDCGEIVQRELARSVLLRAELGLDCWVVMPNHVHLVAVINRKDHGVVGYSREPANREKQSISSFMAGFKSAVTTAINTLRKSPGAPVWQYRFHDHIIRSEGCLDAIRQYIADNPRQWELDKLHPSAQAGSREELDEILAQDAKVKIFTE